MRKKFTRHKINKCTWQTINWRSTPKMTHLEPGDWICKDCGDHNYARRSTCRSCNNQSKTRCTFDSELKIRKAKDVQPGDWQCSICGEVCFASKQSCYHCKTKRHDEPAIIPFQLVVFKHGDWFCTCGFHNFKDRTHCLMCRNKRL